MIVTNNIPYTASHRSSEAVSQNSDPQNNRLPLRLDGGEKKEANSRAEKLDKARHTEPNDKIPAEMISNNATAASSHKSEQAASQEYSSQTQAHKGRIIDVLV